MNDVQIRSALHRQLIRHFHRSGRARVVDELGICHGQSRIDVAVINGRFYGYEIKSERDDLSRLPSQVQAYAHVFNKLTLVIAESFWRDALSILPDWWGIVVATPGPRGGVYLTKHRDAEPNSGLDRRSIARLLWKSEAIDLLKARGYPRTIERDPRAKLYDRLCDQMTVLELQTEVASKLMERDNWRDPRQPS